MATAQEEFENKGLREENRVLRKKLAAYGKALEERKILGRKYKHSQEKFRIIFEKSQLGSEILASDLRMIEVNEALLAILGYNKKKDLINRKILEFAHPDFIEHWHSLQSALWEKKIPTFTIETCLVKKDKTSIWCRVTSILFEDENQTFGYTVLENINDRKNLEEKNKRMYENQELMMHMVAHDLKSPVHIIQTLLGIIKENIENENLVKALFHLKLADQACNRCNTIINDLVLIGELEVGKIEMYPVEFGDIIEHVIEEFKIIAKEKDIKLVHEFTQEDFLVNIDKVKISRALENLLSNAIKFSKKGSEIKVVVEKETDIIIKVIDQGIGIPKRLQPTIFNKFTKAKRKGTEGEQTTGLGLFIAKKIIEIHKGEIWFESDVNKGSTFFIKLPILNPEN